MLTHGKQLSSMFLGVQPCHCPRYNGQNHGIRTIFGTYVHADGMKNSNQILDGGQARCEENFYRVDRQADPLFLEPVNLCTYSVLVECLDSVGWVRGRASGMREVVHQQAPKVLCESCGDLA